MECLLNKGRHVDYPCSPNCPLFGDCLVAYEKSIQPKPTTYGDYLRASISTMSDEELADCFAYFDRCEHCAYEGHCTSKCIGGIKKKLKQPAEEESE